MLITDYRQKYTSYIALISLISLCGIGKYSRFNQASTVKQQKHLLSAPTA
nr:MAG TPA: hypothetical protein [Caudoviricetes sp.]